MGQAQSLEASAIADQSPTTHRLPPPSSSSVPMESLIEEAIAYDSDKNEGSDCVYPFVTLQNCIKANPNAFFKDILEDEEAEKKQQEHPQPQPVQDNKIIPPLWSWESSRKKSKL